MAEEQPKSPAIFTAPDGSSPVDAPSPTEMTAIIVEPKEDILPEWSTHGSLPSDMTCVTMLIGCNAPTRTKSILITPSKRGSLLPCPMSQPSSRTSTSSSTPADRTANTTPERANSINSLKHGSSEQGDEKTLKEHRLNVKFAPLPEMAPRRRHGIPLGVAARSRLVRRRRALVVEGGQQQYVVSTPMWTDEEMEEQRERLAKAWEKEREKREYYSDLDEEEELIEDPIAAFGKFVKYAGKHLWSKVASRDGKEISKDGEGQTKKNNSPEIEETQEPGKTSLERTKEESDSGESPQRLDRPLSTSGLPETENTEPSIEKNQDSLSERGKEDESALSWEDIGGKERSLLSDSDTVIRKKYPWSRARVLSKPKDASSLAKSNSGTNFVRSLRGRSGASKADEAHDSVKAKDMELERSVSSGLRRSLSF